LANKGNDLTHIAEIVDDASRQWFLREFCEEHFSPARLATVRKLFWLLNSVHDNYPTTHVDSDQLATQFAPCLLRQREGDGSDITSKQKRAVRSLIQDFVIVFRE
jgi:hypothetical protein